MWIWALGTAVFLRCNTLVTSGGTLHLLYGSICACHIWDPLYLFPLQPIPFPSCQLHVHIFFYPLLLHCNASSLPPLLCSTDQIHCVCSSQASHIKAICRWGRIFIYITKYTYIYAHLYVYAFRHALQQIISIPLTKTLVHKYFCYQGEHTLTKKS